MRGFRGARSLDDGTAHVRDDRVRDDRVRDEQISFDLIDVPAAVVCALCGDPECPGCAVDETSPASGVIAIIPWERPGLSLPERLWLTARLTTRSADSFFAALPDGPVLQAFGFAVLSELLAILGLLLSALPFVLLFFPELLGALAADPVLRETLLRGVAMGVPSLALLMVLVHAAHGVGLDWGARRNGSSSRRGRGLRFGLYSCGWDLVTLPLGLAIVAIGEGLRAAFRSAPLSLTIPTRAARAYLKGVHQLDDRRVKNAARTGGLFATLMLVGYVAIAITVSVLVGS